jgi:hypothetical protein
MTKSELERIKRQARCEGVREGRRRSQKLINQLSGAMAEVSGLLGEIDFEWPRTGVTISFATADRIIAALKPSATQKARTRLAGELRRMVMDSTCELGMDLARVENEMRELIG